MGSLTRSGATCPQCHMPVHLRRDGSMADHKTDKLTVTGLPGRRTKQACPYSGVTPEEAKAGKTRVAKRREQHREKQAAGTTQIQRIQRKPLKRGEYTGPDDATKAKVWVRAKGRCEYAGCGHAMVDVHHRYERGSGGTGPKSAAAPWINQPANLLGACRHHNDWVSNQQPREAERVGWLLRDASRPACQEPVQTCHDPLPVWLDDAGNWYRFEEGAA